MASSYSRKDGPKAAAGKDTTSSKAIKVAGSFAGDPWVYGGPFESKNVHKYKDAHEKDHSGKEWDKLNAQAEKHYSKVHKDKGVGPEHNNVTKDGRSVCKTCGRRESDLE